MPKGHYGPRHRRSVKDDAPNRWVGWDRILELHGKAVVLDKVTDTVDHSLYFVVLFETGGRVSECIKLRPEQVRWNDSQIRIDVMEVLKRRKRFTRDVAILREGNPLADAFVDHVEACETDFLLPGYSEAFTRAVDLHGHASASHVYRKITAIDPDLWPHRLRDMRSWHLSAKIEEGGRGFDAYLLRAWFEWQSMEMPAHYAGRREFKDILKALDIDDF